MSQNDQSIANADGATVRADINSALQALASVSAGATAPSTTYPNQWWMDTTTNILKQRDNANAAWVNVASKSGTNWIPYRNGTLLGDAATKTIGTSGATVPLLNAANTWGAAQNFADQILQRPELKDYAETVNAIGGTGGGTQDIDLTLGGVVTATVDTSANTFTFSNPPASGKGGSFTLILTNGGSQTVTWPASVDWGGGTAPTLTTAGVDYLTFVTVDGGTTWAGFVADLDVK